MMWLVIAVIVVVGYLLGSIPSGLLISKSQGMDIRAHGSGNIGATNVWRVMGRKFGLLAFFADTAKGWLAVTFGFWLAAHFPVTAHLSHGHERIEFFDPGFAGITAALGCILGHNFPVWLRFRGGKGVATSLGVIVGMMPLVSLIIFAVWGLTLKTTRYVSLASLVGAACLPVATIVLMFFGPASGWAAVHGWANFYFACAAALLVLRRHTANISRLLAGTENRFGTPKSAEESAVNEGQDAPPASHEF